MSISQTRSTYPTFTKGQLLESKTHGRVEFVRMDSYMGETTYEFKSLTYGGKCHWLPESLDQHLYPDALSSAPDSDRFREIERQRDELQTENKRQAEELESARMQLNNRSVSNMEASSAFALAAVQEQLAEAKRLQCNCTITTHPDGKIGTCCGSVQMMGNLAAVTKQRDELQKDAERYRWMRSNRGQTGRLHLSFALAMVTRPNELHSINDEDLDSAIDAAITSAKGGAA